ncbi:hypothetical protein CC2G_008043 [Coprinopsis cinerea AmutBmut pab1-1]|nr:hypothetical protein CC2G_008043 [Coprinopsis cinerea AmutBmut pab1-1]
MRRPMNDPNSESGLEFTVESVSSIAQQINHDFIHRITNASALWAPFPPPPHIQLQYSAMNEVTMWCIVSWIRRPKNPCTKASAEFQEPLGLRLQNCIWLNLVAWTLLVILWIRQWALFSAA